MELRQNPFIPFGTLLWVSLILRCMLHPKWCFLEDPSICQVFGVLFLCVVLLVLLLLHINSCCQHPLGLIDLDCSRPLLDLHKDAVFSPLLKYFICPVGIVLLLVLVWYSFKILKVINSSKCLHCLFASVMAVTFVMINWTNNIINFFNSLPSEWFQGFIIFEESGYMIKQYVYIGCYSCLFIAQHFSTKWQE